MRQVTPEVRALTWRLLAQEAEGRQGNEALAIATERVCQKLHRQLAELIGSFAFDAILARAVHTAQAEFPSLQGIEVSAEGSLQGLGRSIEGRDAVEVRDSLVAVLASFLGLLAVFIGMNLVRGQLEHVWPDVQLGDVDFDRGGDQ